MASGKSILLGSVVIGAAIVAAAYVWRAPAPTVTATEAGAPAASETGVPGRYRIVRIEDGVSWRLDTVTGELTACRMEGDRMLCARSSEATELPKATAQELEERRKADEQAAEESRARRGEEKTALFERFLSFFRWVVEQAMEADRAAEPPEAAPGTGDGPRTL